MSLGRAGRLGGLLCMAAGFLFIVLGVLQRERDLVRIFFGIALLAAGVVWTRMGKG